jgi:predicted nucleic acid-binding protein
MRIIPAILLCVTASAAMASDLTFQFSNPSFSGNGWSTHVLTIQQLEEKAKQKNKDDVEAAEAEAERDYKSTNIYKFQNNLESRIYAQLSKNIADQLFGEIDAWTSATAYAKGAVVVYNGEQYKSTIADNLGTPGSGTGWKVYDVTDWAEAETPFGDLIKWKRVDGVVFVEVYDSNGDLASEFQTPVGDFAF